MNTLLLSGWILTLILAGILAWQLVVEIRRERKRYEEALEIERAINYFSTSLSGRNGIEEILWDITKNCIARLGFEDCVIYLVDEKREMLVQKAAYGPKNPVNFEIVNRIEIPIGKGIVGSVAEKGAPEIVDDTSEDFRYIKDDERRNAEIAVPIMYEGKVLGVIDAEHHEKYFFKEKHLRILTTIASICANKVVRRQSEEEYQKAEAELKQKKLDMKMSRLESLRFGINLSLIESSLKTLSEFIIRENTAQAKNYLSALSGFIREAFVNAHSDWVVLEKDIRAIELFFKMERLLHSTGFEITLDIDNSVEPASLKVPPHLVLSLTGIAVNQYVHKPGAVKMAVAIRFYKPEEKLFISIEYASLKEYDRKGMFTYSESAEKDAPESEERIRILNELYGLGITCSFSDIFDEEGIACGRKTLISLLPRVIEVRNADKKKPLAEL